MSNGDGGARLRLVLASKVRRTSGSASHFAGRTMPKHVGGFPVAAGGRGQVWKLALRIHE